jgi:SAM-dependent methyltransferase
MDTATDLAVAAQHTFVRGAIGGARRVLEVGAGRGHLARRLCADGFEVTALDLSLPARDDSSGVRWIEGDFVQFEDEPFDAVVFTSSLHHITPLAAALDRARDLLVPDGLLVVDDFALEAPDENTARWYYELQDVLAVAGVFKAAHAHERQARPPLDRWRVEHEHHDAPLHTGRAMLAEVEKRFGSPEVTRGAYLFRHTCAGLSNVELARHVMSLEEQRIADGSLQAVGLRVVVRRTGRA